MLSWESSKSLRWRRERVDLRRKLYILAIYRARIAKLNLESTKKNLLSGILLLRICPKALPWPYLRSGSESRLRNR